MNKNLKTVLIVVVVLLLGVLVYKLITYKTRPLYFKSVTFENTNYVANNTELKYVDTVIRVGLDLLEIHNVQILIKPLTQKAKDQFAKDGIELKAHIRESNGGYTVWIDDLTKDEMITVLSHELIHLKQYSDNRLSVVGSNVIWLGEFNDLSVTGYEDRPWEIEAFNKQAQMRSDILKIVY